MDEKKAESPDPKARREQMATAVKSRLGELAAQRALLRSQLEAVDRQVAECEADVIALEKMLSLL
jgi:hypothetical protein